MLKYLLGWLHGYVVITVFGDNKEQFLNLALQRNIDIYDVEWHEDGYSVIIAKVAYGDIGKLRQIRRKVGCGFKLGKRRGWPFFYRYLQKRKMLVAGFLIFCLGLYVLSGFVWQIKVVPRENIKYLDNEEILTLCEQYGIKKGVWGGNIDFDTVEKQLIMQIPELSWVSVEKEGILVKINIAERDLWTEDDENATVGAIWANRKALIEELLIKHGTAVVNEGDVVEKGALLVSPLADGKADAIIKGRVWYVGYGECSMNQSVLKKTENPQVQVYLLRHNAEGVDNSRLKLWGGIDETDLTEYSVEEEFAKPRIWGNIFLPVDVLIQWVTPVKAVEITYTEADAKAKALAQARNSLKQQIGENNRLIDESVEYALRNGVCTVTVRWECKEEIGVRNVSAEN